MASTLPNFKVALVQTRPKPLDHEFNFLRASEEIRCAASQGAALAVLPEYHLTGWAPNAPGFALTAENTRMYQKRYADLAAELHINICAGTIVTKAPTQKALPGTGDSTQDPTSALLNTSFFIDHNGRLLGSYTKTNLWIPERHHLTSFTDYISQMRPERTSETIHKVLNTPLGPIGILVCWDLAFPEAFRQLVLAGAKIIIIPSYWTLSDMSKEGLAYNAECERMFVQSALVTRAFESTAAIIYCNAAGPSEEGFFGCSQVTLPIVGTVPGSFTDGREGTRVVDVDMHVVDVAERNYLIRQDLAREDWHYGYVRKQTGSTVSEGLDAKPLAQL